MRSRSRAGLLVGLTVALSGALTVASMPMADAATKVGTVTTAGAPLVVRAGASSSTAALRSLKNGTKVTLECYVRGQSVKGKWGTTTIWDRIAGGGYVSDGFIYTGTNNPVVPPCPTAPPKPPTTPAPAGFMLPYPKGKKYTVTNYPHHLYPKNQYNNVDFNFPSGSTVLASNYGTVYYAGWHRELGWEVLINHGNDYCTIYGHLSSLSVKTGQKVNRGQFLGRSGNTGSGSHGAHLHWGARSCKQQLNRTIRTVEVPNGDWRQGTAYVSRNG